MCLSLLRDPAITIVLIGSWTLFWRVKTQLVKNKITNGFSGIYPPWNILELTVRTCEYMPSKRKIEYSNHRFNCCEDIYILYTYIYLNKTDMSNVRFPVTDPIQKTTRLQQATRPQEMTGKMGPTTWRIIPGLVSG